MPPTRASNFTAETSSSTTVTTSSTTSTTTTTPVMLQNKWFSEKLFSTPHFQVPQECLKHMNAYKKNVQIF
jgi:hypothetical protein